MNTNSASLRPQIRGRSCPFRSLLVATAAAFVLIGFIVPNADGIVVAYYNFENAPTGTSPVDLTPDLIPGRTQVLDSMIVGDNMGGGVEPYVSDLTITTPGLEASTSGLLLNRTPGDNDTNDPGLALNLSRSSKGEADISFTVNLEHYAGLSLSFAVNNNGNGYGNVQLTWSGAVSGSTAVLAMPTAGTQIVSFDLTGTNLDGDGFTSKIVTFTLRFTNGQSNGVDQQTVIDNILLSGFVVPEPATVWGGLLGACVLCWHQRRRLIGFLPLRRG
jgi:hypothetical protein